MKDIGNEKNRFTQTDQARDEETEDKHPGHGPQAGMSSGHIIRFLFRQEGPRRRLSTGCAKRAERENKF